MCILFLFLGPSPAAHQAPGQLVSADDDGAISAAKLRQALGAWRGVPGLELMSAAELHGVCWRRRLGKPGRRGNEGGRVVMHMFDWRLSIRGTLRVPLKSAQRTITRPMRTWFFSPALYECKELSYQQAGFLSLVSPKSTEALQVRGQRTSGAQLVPVPESAR